MVTKRHNISIVVNGEQLELESQDKVNLRINNTLYNPEKISVTQSEYSFSFSVPTSPKNNKIFGFANIPSVKGKFIRQFDTYVYADNVEIFKGLLRISSIADGSYKCNLISVKNSSIDEIFGDSTMNEVTWEVPYNGAATINAINEEDNPDYFFPLVCYGAFQKDPYRSIASEDSTLSYYTSTNLLDKYTKFYNETFIPSPNIIALIKKMIEGKGYTYSGDVFNDEMITRMYLSSMISDEQDPAYNYGGERGHIIVESTFDITGYDQDGSRYASSRAYNGRVGRELTYPEFLNCYYTAYPFEVRDDMGTDEGYIYPLWDKSYTTQTTQTNDEMYEDGYIIIPHDGYYKIRMDAEVIITDTATEVKDSYPHLEWDSDDREYKLHHTKRSRTMNLYQVPVDVQLVKNGSDSLEFIATNKINLENQKDIAYTGAYWSDYPHEAGSVNTGERTVTSGRRGVNYYETMEYYYQIKGRTRGYDPRVNPDFVMGMSTTTNGWAVMKRGKSWDGTVDADGKNQYDCLGYYDHVLDYSSGSAVENIKYTDYQAQDSSCPSCTYNALSAKDHKGVGYAIVWLNKNDMLDCKALVKNFRWWTQETGDDDCIREFMPSMRIYTRVDLQAWSPYKKDLDKSWSSSSAFGTNLNLGNFLSDNETQKDFFNNFLTTFNLTCNIENGNIDINKNVLTTDSSECVDVDDRVDVNDVEMEIIDFPTSIQVKWTTSDDESGFYNSVPSDHINDDDWKDWADIGSEKVTLSKNNFSTNDISKTSKFSYNWWMDFTLSDWYNYDGTVHHEDDTQKLELPIIAKDENFIDGADYEEMMSKDGRGLKQRLWFKGQNTQMFVPNRNGAIYTTGEKLTYAKEYIEITTPWAYWKGKNIFKYTSDKDCLLMKYFNINEDTDSNYATIEVYLTPQEYIRIKNGALVRFDNDRYKVCKITGYDPVGGNKTKIQMMKL